MNTYHKPIDMYDTKLSSIFHTLVDISHFAYVFHSCNKYVSNTAIFGHEKTTNTKKETWSFKRVTLLLWESYVLNDFKRLNCKEKNWHIIKIRIARFCKHCICCRSMCIICFYSIISSEINSLELFLYKYFHKLMVITIYNCALKWISSNK